MTTHPALLASLLGFAAVAAAGHLGPSPVRTGVRVLGHFTLGLLALAAFPLVVAAGVLARVPFGKICRILAILALAALLSHEVAELFGFDIKTAKDRLLARVRHPITKAAVEAVTAPAVPEGGKAAFVAAMKSLGLNGGALWASVDHGAALEAQVRQALKAHGN
jgi:hypothetical protein